MTGEEDAVTDATETSEVADAKQTEEEVKARATGWVPPGEWKGDPKNWKPAEVWNDGDPKVLRREIGKLERKLAEQEAKFEKGLEGLKAATKRGLEAQAEQIRAEYEAKKEKAVELGDTDAYKAAVKGENAAIERITKQADKDTEKAETKLKDKGELDVLADKWVGENDWYSSSKVLARRFDAIYAELEEDAPGMTIVERLAEAKDRLIEQNPEKFGRRAPTERVQRVDGGGGRNPGGGNGADTGGWSKLDKATQSVADDLIRSDGLFLSDEARKEWRKTKKVSDKEMGAARTRYAQEAAKGQKAA